MWRATLGSLTISCVLAVVDAQISLCPLIPHLPEKKNYVMYTPNTSILPVHTDKRTGMCMPHTSDFNEFGILKYGNSHAEFLRFLFDSFQFPTFLAASRRFLQSSSRNFYFCWQSFLFPETSFLLPVVVLAVVFPYPLLTDSGFTKASDHQFLQGGLQVKQNTLAPCGKQKRILRSEN